MLASSYNFSHRHVRHSLNRVSCPQGTFDLWCEVEASQTQTKSGNYMFFFLLGNSETEKTKVHGVRKSRQSFFQINDRPITAIFKLQKQ